MTDPTLVAASDGKPAKWVVTFLAGEDPEYADKNKAEVWLTSSSLKVAFSSPTVFSYESLIRLNPF